VHIQKRIDRLDPENIRLSMNPGATPELACIGPLTPKGDLMR
jgi:hypothetical protein